MPDNFIQLDIDDTKLNKLLKELRARGKDFSPLTKEIADHLYNVTDENFDNAGSFFNECLLDFLYV